MAGDGTAAEGVAGAVLDPANCQSLSAARGAVRSLTACTLWVVDTKADTASDMMTTPATVAMSAVHLRRQYTAAGSGPTGSNM